MASYTPEQMRGFARHLDALDRPAPADMLRWAADIIERLPVTADGVPIAPGMVVYAEPESNADDGSVLVTGVTNYGACAGLEHDPDAERSIRHAGHDCHHDCDAAVPACAVYSTREAAEAAKERT